MFAYDHNHVAVLVCGRFGFLTWPFWFVAVLDVIPDKHRAIAYTARSEIVQ